jgi:hypothetical protein
LLFVVLVATAGKVAAVTDTFNASGTWVAPAGVTSVIVEAWGGGGGGHDGSNAGDYGGGGGGGGAYASSVVTVTPGNSYAITIGAGGANGTPGNNGGATSFDGSTVVAAGGRGAGSTTGGGTGGTIAASTGTIRFAGCNGGNGATNTAGTGEAGGGGGGSPTAAGSCSNGGNGAGRSSGGAGGTGEGTGGDGGVRGPNATASTAPGGGGGGGSERSQSTGTAGAAGRVVLTYTLPGGGCTSSTVGIDTVVVCTGNDTLTIPAGVSVVRYLLVAGGGGGGGIGTGNEDGAGGGGAGGVLAGTGFAVTAGNYNVVVGSGGAAGTGTSNGGNGGDSTFSTLTAIGGGGGAREGGVDGNDGGSGGGGSDNNNGGSGTPGQGNDGGNGNNNDGGGGGGGAGGVGQPGTSATGGDGGPGIVDDITGVSVTYGGGGGGGADQGGPGGAGGAGGGATAPTGRGPGVDGTANTGGGGSGATGSNSGAAFNGGAGGSGVVVIRYKTPGLVAEYRLDELSWNGTPGEVLDSSPNGLNGTAIASAIPIPARVCNGARLNIPPAPLTDYIEVPDDPLLDITTALTVTAWVNPSAYPASGLMTVLSKDTNYEFHITSTGQVNWWWNTGAAALTTGAGAVPLNTWTHIAITFALGQQIIYVNGVPVATGTDGAALFTNNLPLQIGEDQGFGGGSRRWRGLIDEVQVHDRTLSAGEVVTIMNTTRPCLSSVDHYYVQHAASGVNCQAENITITAHDINHVATNAESRIITITAARVAGAAGNRGDFALVAGTGVFNNGAADDGVATYAFGTSEVQVVLAYKNTWVQTVNMDVTDGTATDTSGTASADAGYNQDLSFVPAGFRIVDAGNNTIPNQVAGVTDGPFYLQAIQTGAGGCTTPGPCTGVCTVPSAFGNGASVDVDLAFSCDNPTTCQAGQQVSIVNSGSTAIAANPATGVTAWTTKTLLFGANGQAAFDMVYPDVGALSLHTQYDIPLQDGSPSGNLMTGQSNSFVVSPFDFAIASTAPNEIKRTSDGFVNPGASTATDVPFFIRAGDDFTVTVTAVNQSGAATPNYGQEIAPESVLLTSNLVGGLGLTNNPALTNPSSFGAFSNGTATGTTFSWGEVGIITLTPSVGDGNYLGAGDVTGTPSGNVGRFVPFDFAVTRNAPLFDAGCSVAGKDAFTYIGEPFVYQTAPVITVTARNSAGGTTQNYSGDFFRITSTSLTGKSYTAATGSLILTGVPGTDPVIRYNGDGIAAPPPPAAGVGTLTFSAGTGLKFTRSTPIVAFDADIALAINVADEDSTVVALIDGVAGVNPIQFGQATAGNGILFSGTTVTAGKTPREMRFGRLRMFNASGTSRLALPLRVQAEFYTTNGFVANGDDSCTSFSGSDNAMAFVPSTNLVACETAVVPSGALTLTDGQAGAIQLAAPGIGNDGSVDLKINLGAAAGNTCTTVGGASAPATFTLLDYLQGNWGGSASWDQDPSARATFGIYNNAAEFLYLQENY